MRTAALALFFLQIYFGSSRVIAASEISLPQATSRALIIVGLPGDPAHETLFRSTSNQWRDWLVASLGFDRANVRILEGTQIEIGRNDAPATRDSITREVDSIRAATSPEDRLWIFVLGHANLDNGHGIIHLPGPDLNEEQFATLFREFPGREQVFWMTTPASGAFVKPLARPGRIVIAATEPQGESNETEFPLALTEVIQRPPAKLDVNKDGQVSILEIFDATSEIVEARFATDKRVPTEHARIDDNGDGLGTEFRNVEKLTIPDGLLASQTMLPYLRPTPPANSSPRSENGTKSVVPPAR